MTKIRLLVFAACAAASTAAPAQADGGRAEPWRLDAQATNVTQWHPRFRSPYGGANSLQPRESAKETTDVTVFAGWRPDPDTEFWVNPEIDQGFGLSDTLGVAGFPSGEAYKVGQNRPYLRLPRVFVRHTVSLGGEARTTDSGTNQFAVETTADRLVLTLGRFSVVDIFDANTYAHDPRSDFMNWSVVDAGVFDYAADPWGYTFGATAEWTHGAWVFRGGAFQVSQEPNDKVAGLHPRQHMLVAEVERSHAWGGHSGKLKLLAFWNRAKMAGYDDAVRVAVATGQTPDLSLVRRWQSRGGVAVNFEQELSHALGVFARAGANDGGKEAYEFTEINRTLSAGLALKGESWSRGNDTLGVAFAVNALSQPARRYFAAGGLGILIGDGALRYATERILEAYYAVHISRNIAVTADYQRIVNPAYNADRGPVDVYAVRFHAEF